jgi:hypothetical protein
MSFSNTCIIEIFCNNVLRFHFFSVSYDEQEVITQAGGVVLVIKCLPQKCGALSSNFSVSKKDVISHRQGPVYKFLKG